MRLDHLLSMENRAEEIRLNTSKGQITGSGKSEEATLFNFEGSERNASKPYGGVAQLGEHLPCTQGVRSSNLLISTSEVEKDCARQGLIAQPVRAHA